MARVLSDREKRLTQLGYKALALGYKGQHRGARWVAHMAGKAGRLFELSIEEWKARVNLDARVDWAAMRRTADDITSNAKVSGGGAFPPSA